MWSLWAAAAGTGDRVATGSTIFEVTNDRREFINNYFRIVAWWRLRGAILSWEETGAGDVPMQHFPFQNETCSFDLVWRGIRVKYRSNLRLGVDMQISNDYCSAFELHHNNFPSDICDGEHSRHIWLHDKYPSTFWSGLKDNRWSNKHSDSISCSISSITPKSKVHKWDADECPCNVGLVQPVRKQLLQRRFLVRYSISKKCPRRQCIQNCWEWIAEYQLCSHCPIIKSGIGRMPQICVSIDSSRGIGECGRGVGIRVVWEYHEHLHSVGH